MAKYFRQLMLATLIIVMIQPCFANVILNKLSHSVFTIMSVNTDGPETITLGSAIAIKKNVLATNCKNRDGRKFFNN